MPATEHFSAPEERTEPITKIVNGHKVTVGHVVYDERAGRIRPTPSESYAESPNCVCSRCAGSGEYDGICPTCFGEGYVYKDAPR